jgi:uncharacterized protein (TIGR03435 family)
VRYLIAAMIALNVAAHAQSPPSSFDVASIKRSRSIEGGGSARLQPGGRYIMINGPVRVLLTTAYPTLTSEIVDAPDWVTYEKYDVDARAGRDLRYEELTPLLRSLLADRFKLRAHLETRVRPVYELRVARTDQRLGPEMRQSKIDCESRPGECWTRGGGNSGVIESNGISMMSFVTWLPARVGRPVLDKTGLVEDYELLLKYSVAATDDAPAFPTALREQLGLELRAVEIPTEVLVIDYIERPSEN